MHLDPLRKNLGNLEEFKRTEKLRDVKDALRRGQKVRFQEPEAVSTDLGLDWKLLYQRKKVITNPEDWWMECARYAVDVTLDPETAHPNLILSEDRKSVRWGDTRQNVPGNPGRFDTELCVLGCEGFTSGIHYWEVELGDVTGCKIGVCRDSVKRKGVSTQSPEEGYFTLRLLNELRYVTLTSCVTPIPLSETLQAVGIRLDNESGKVTFYDADNRSPLFTFMDFFMVEVRPFFYTYSRNPLRIRPVPG
uniref:E3 ubiquitin-protein ligase TRIM39-like n=1 Tax=Geotrypetes seraphini TaxID=260995 RepID=A0A6P8RLU4_GEOSA|nr:E3 ubiquitin-protein ligase TRIM39-like [Geotrypetes seraphini]